MKIKMLDFNRKNETEHQNSDWIGKTYDVAHLGIGSNLLAEILDDGRFFRTSRILKIELLTDLLFIETSNTNYKFKIL